MEAKPDSLSWRPRRVVALGCGRSGPAENLVSGAAAHRGDGRLRLHGHGSRERTVWEPTLAATATALTSVRVRRYRCTNCGAARTVLPHGLARGLRYSLSAIALALTAWMVADRRERQTD